MKNKKTKPKKCGLCDDCTFKLYKDDYIVSCAYFRKNISYFQIKFCGGCRAFVERIRQIKTNFFRHFHWW